MCAAGLLHIGTVADPAADMNDHVVRYTISDVGRPEVARPATDLKDETVNRPGSNKAQGRLTALGLRPNPLATGQNQLVHLPEQEALPSRKGD